MDETPADITVRIARENAYDDGWWDGVATEREAWNRIIGAYGNIVDVPLWAARTKLRNDQCSAACGHCSRCVRAGAVARHNGDHTGGPVTW